MTSIANHLWQSTLFAILAWMLTLTLKKNRAAARYWIWLAASIKFLVPLSVLVALGGRSEGGRLRWSRCRVPSQW